MDQQDIRTLKILEEIGKGQTPSQRDLSRKLNISLGLVNSFVKRLIHKGYFKATTLPANRVKYLLTPKGAAEKTRLTFEYIKYSFEYYRESRQRLRRLFHTLEEEGIKRIIFYGASDLAEIAFVSLQDAPLELVAVVDNENKGKKFLGTEVLGDNALCELSFDMILVTTIEHVEKIQRRIKGRGVSRQRILMLY